jgi:hypothetical protein
MGLDLVKAALKAGQVSIVTVYISPTNSSHLIIFSIKICLNMLM